MIPMICVYCGSNEGIDPAFGRAAADMARALTRRGAGIVYGGGTRGLMGAVAAAALEARAPLKGVVPSRFRSDRSTAPEGAEYLFVDSMQERKAAMRDLSLGFVALPRGHRHHRRGGRDLDAEVAGFHAKPLALLNVGGFFDGLTGFLRDVAAAGFMKPRLSRGHHRLGGSRRPWRPTSSRPWPPAVPAA